MGKIRTLSGDIFKWELGFTYSHEHIVCVPSYWQEKNEGDLLLDSPGKSKSDVLDFKRLGGRSIVDATAIDYGRRVNEVKRISDETGVQIIGTAGFNKSLLWGAKIREDLRPLVGGFTTYGQWIDEWSVNRLAEFVISEVEEGMEGTGIKSGQLKFGVSYNRIYPLEIKTLEAVAIAHSETKAPIHVHTEAGTMALEIIGLLKEKGIDPEYVSIGHMDRNLDPYYHEQVAKTGAYLCFDGIGKIKYAPESERIRCILELVKKGFEDKLLMSGDTARKTYYKSYEYGPGLEYILLKWIPRFVDEAGRQGMDGNRLIQKFFIDNPANCFEFKN